MLPSADLTDPATFADDSYEANGGTPDLIVTAQMPSACTLDACAALVRALHTNRSAPFELKFKHWQRASQQPQTRELAHRAGRELRQALVSVVDANRYSLERAEWERRWIGPALERFPLGSPLGDRLRSMRSRWDDDALAASSVARRIEYWMPGADIEPEGRPTSHNLRIDLARSNAALADVFERDRQRSLFREHAARFRFMDAAGVMVEMLRPSLVVVRCFDEGNRTSIDRIRVRRERLHEIVRSHDAARGAPAPRLGGTAEAPSHSTLPVQAADVAAGLARRWYREPDGVKRLVDEFARVVVNGTILK
ncbi:MAG: hypothetical protein HMLKMBBP_01069 [Planctomycetes bacterium]|nr:hypothetical protein [Planctomycetota bacterium]